jgi:hypothetical protein
MHKDMKLVWVVEYLIGIGFLVAVLPFILHPQPGWSPAHGWAYLLFIACAGISLISSASGTRQRIELSKRIAELEDMLDGLKTCQKHSQNENNQKNVNTEKFINSVN